MTRWDVCNARLKQFSPSVFLEIGTGGGWAAYNEIHADVIIGVDPAPQGHVESYTHHYRMTSDEFFTQLIPFQFHAVLVDGLHHAEQVLKDVENGLGYLVEGGLIVMHDCNPIHEWAQVIPAVRSFWNGDCWKAMVMLRSTRPDLDAYTINSDQGLGLVTRRSMPRPLISAPPLAELTWEGLCAHRKEWLGLIEL